MWLVYFTNIKNEGSKQFSRKWLNDRNTCRPRNSTPFKGCFLATAEVKHGDFEIPNFWQNEMISNQSRYHQHSTSNHNMYQARYKNKHSLMWHSYLRVYEMSSLHHKKDHEHTYLLCFWPLMKSTMWKYGHGGLTLFQRMHW